MTRTITGIAVTLLAGLPAGASASPEPVARAAHSLNGYSNCNGHYIKSSGSILVEEGPCSGPLSGSLRADVHVGTTFSGTFTFNTRYGQIRGHGSAKPHNAGNGIESFAGTLVVTGGTGRYAHARGSARLYGTFNRKTYGVVAQTRGTLSY